MELLFIIRPGAAGAPDHSAAVYHSPSSCCLWSCSLSFALELLFMEMLFALELLFIIRPGAPDHGAAGAPLLVLFIIRPGAPDHGAAGCL